MFSILLFYENINIYQNNIKSIIDQIDNLYEKDVKVFIIVDYHRINYLTHDKIIYFHPNTDNELLNLLTHSIYLKQKNLTKFTKFKYFLYFFFYLDKILKKYNLNFILKVNPSFTLKKKIDPNFKEILPSKNELAAYVGRYNMNFIDDENFLIFNTKHQLFKKYINYIKKKLDDHSFFEDYELSSEYLLTKIRYKFQNKFKVKFKDILMNNKLKTNKNKNPFNNLSYSIISQYYDIPNEIYDNYKKIKTFHFSKMINNKINPNFLYQHLDLEGLINSNKILYVSNIDTNINLIFPNHCFDKINLKELTFFFKKKIFYYTILIETDFFTLEKFKEFIVKLKKNCDEMIIKTPNTIKEKKNYFLNKNDKNFSHFIYKNFSSVEEFKNQKNLIYVCKK